MLEGQAAASHSVLPNRATARPHVERTYTATGAATNHLPTTARPKTAGLTARQQQQPFGARGVGADYSVYQSMPSQTAWTESVPAAALPVQQSTFTASNYSSSSYVDPRLRPAAGFTYRDQPHTSQQQSPVAAAAAGRSQTFRPQLSTSISAPDFTKTSATTANAANAAAPDRTIKRAVAQGGAYQELEL